MVKLETIEIAGPVGKLEMIYIPAEGVEKGVAVINHPNPLHGGTFTNKVIQTAAKALSKLGFHCYLPNLRGVGNRRLRGGHRFCSQPTPAGGAVGDCRFFVWWLCFAVCLAFARAGFAAADGAGGAPI